jgi:hypothetical protein
MVFSTTNYFNIFTYLNAVRRKRFNMTVVYEGDAVHIDNSEIWRGSLQFVDVDNFIDLLLLFFNFLICT